MIEIDLKFLIIVAAIGVVAYLILKKEDLLPIPHPTIKPDDHPTLSRHDEGCCLEGRPPVESRLAGEPNEQSLEYSVDAQFSGTSFADDFYNDVQLSGAFKL